MKISEMKRKLLFIAFAAVDFFAAIEVTSFIVASPKVVEYFDISKTDISWIINSYLYVVFAALVLFYFISKKIKHTANIKVFFLFGLGLFFLGSVLGAFSTDIQMFYVARAIQGIGAALSFVGQLWVMTYSFKEEIGKPLFWTELGAAGGVMAGPFLGGISSDISAGGWRLLFVFNAIVVFVAMFFVYFLYNDRPRQVALSEKKFRKDFYFAMIIIIATIAVAVASEFVVSIFLQQFKSYSGVAAGLVLLSGSLGLIFGSAIASRIKTKKHQLIIKGLWGLLLATLFMGIILSFGMLFLAPVAFFIVGFFYGYLSVMLYAYISHMLPQNLLVKGITIYLIALQIGNATGIYTEKIWSFFGYDFFVFTFFMIIGIILALLFAIQLTNLENIEGDLYEVAPLGKTPFAIAGLFIEEIKNLFQALFYIIVIIPFKFFMNIKSYGLDDIEMKDQMIVIANHGARLDAWVILAGLGFKNFMKLHPFRIPIDKTIFNIPFLKHFFHFTGIYCIESKGDLAKSLEDTLGHIDNGHSIIFFPHGRMLKKGELGDPKKGIGHLIQNRRIHILPAKIIYTSFNSRHRGAMRNANVIFGDSIHSEHIKNNNTEDNLHHVAMDYVHKIDMNINRLFHNNNPQVTDVVRQYSEENLNTLLGVIKGAFPPYWINSREKSFYKDILLNSENVVIFLKEYERVVGCLIAMPHNSAVKSISKSDSLMKRKREKLFYVETIAVLPNHRNKFGHFKLLVQLVSESRKRGINAYSMHVRKENGFSNQIQQLFKKEIISVREMKWEWRESTEVMDYIECRFSRSILYLKSLFFIYRTYTYSRRFKKNLRLLMERVTASMFKSD